MQIRNLWRFAALSALAIGAAACGDSTSTTPTINSFVASPTSVTMGGTTTLTWDVSNADTIAITANPGGEVQAETNMLTGMVTSAALSANTTFTLTAKKGEDEVKRDITVTISTGGDVTANLSVSPTTIGPGQSATLTWTSMNATAIKIDDGDGNSVVPSGTMFTGTQMVMPTVTTDYILTADGPNGPVTSQVTLTYSDTPQAPTINSFAANPATIDEGNSSTLSWDVANADAIVVTAVSDGSQVYSGAEAISQATVTPAATETYRLVATNAGGSVMMDASVTVNVPQLPIINDWAATPTTVNIGELSTLSWDVSNTTSINIEAGGQVLTSSTALTGSYTVTPTVTTSYTLRATNANGENTALVSVTVNASAPAISAFAASPNPAALGGSSDVSWTVLGADWVGLQKDGADVSTQGQVGMGTVTEVVTATSAVYTLTATNAIGRTTQSITLTAQDAATVDQFDVTPLSVLTTPATATVTYATSNATSVELYANGTLVAGFPSTTLSGSANFQIFGSTFVEIVAINAVSQARENATIVQVIAKTEPNDSPTDTGVQTLAGDGSGVAGQINPNTDLDFFRVDVPAGGWVRAETSDGAGGCGLDTVIRLWDTDGTTELVSDDQGGNGNCSLIDPSGVPAAAELAGGTYYVSVESWNQNSSGSYVLTVEAGPAACGNLIIESTVNNESCDDGNANNGDGCSDQCALEVAGVITPPGGTVSVNLPTLESFQLINVEVTQGGQAITAITSDGAGGCPLQTTVALFLEEPPGSNQFVNLGVGGANGPQGCTAIIFPDDLFATNLSTGTYSLGIFNVDAIPGQVQVDVTVQDAMCGNTVVETNGGETCEGATLCNNCQFAGVSETEPDNNVFTTADDLGTVGTATVPVVAALDPVADEDWFQITVGVESFIFAETIEDVTEVAPNRCPNIDTDIALFDSDGTTQLDFDDDGGDTWCSRIDGIAVAPGTYYIRVRSSVQFAANAIWPIYYLLAWAEPQPPEAPLITSTPGLQAVEGTSYVYTVTADGVPTPTITAPILPTWLIWDAQTNTASGTPGAANVGANTVEFQATNASGTDTQNFTINVVGAGSVLIGSSSPALPIPDNDPVGVTDTITLAGTCVVGAVTVDMDITHTWQGDITLELTSPTGTIVRLRDGTGGGADDIIGNFPADLVVDGPGTLADFVGNNGIGAWTLFVSDSANFDTGTLNSWTLTVTCQ